MLRNEPDGYFLDLENRQWQPLVVQSKALQGGAGQISEAFDLKDYLVFKHSKEAISGYFFLDKNPLKFYFWNKPNTMGSSPFFIISGNQLIYQEIQSGLVIVDFNKDYDEFELVGQLLFSTNTTNTNAFVAAGIVLFLLMTTFLAYRKGLFQKHIPRANGFDPDALDQLIDLFSKRSGSVLQIDELDQMLDINHLPNPDYKRVCRS